MKWKNMGWLQSRAEGGWEQLCFVNKVRLKAQRKRESEGAREKCIAFLTILQAFGRASHWLTLTRSPGKCDLHGSNHHDTEHSKGKVGSALKKKIHSNGNDFAEATWASPVAKTVKNLLAMQETWI